MTVLAKFYNVGKTTIYDIKPYGKDGTIIKYVSKLGTVYDLKERKTVRMVNYTWLENSNTCLQVDQY